MAEPGLLALPRPQSLILVTILLLGTMKYGYVFLSDI